MDMFEQEVFSFAEPQPKPPLFTPMLGSLPSEYTAIPYFFKSHVLWERHEDSQNGYLELLPKLYGDANASPLLHTATYAVALGIMSNAYQSIEMRCEARKQYGKALSNLGLAIKDVNLATADEIIMTILLFVLYEVSIRPVRCNPCLTMCSKLWETYNERFNGQVTSMEQWPWSR